MRQKLSTLIAIIISTCVNVVAQNLQLQWTRNYGGNDSEAPYAIRQTLDGGYITAGSTMSTSFPNTPIPSNSHGGEDIYVVKTDATENIQWRKCFGGSGNDLASDLITTSDGGIIVAGYYFAQNNMPMVTQLLNIWPATTNTIENNYKLYFSWMLQMYNNPTWVPNMQTALAMGSKCPYKNSNVVFAAQNLYNTLTKQHLIFESDCETEAYNLAKHKTIVSARKNNTVTETLNNITIYPNPTSSNITITGSNIKTIVVYNSEGKQMAQYAVNAKFINQVNLASFNKGLYLIQLVKQDGSIETRKILKQ
jgi:hypothetical protein